MPDCSQCETEPANVNRNFRHSASNVFCILISGLPIWYFATSIPVAYACRCGGDGPMGTIWGLAAAPVVAAAAGFAYGQLSTRDFSPCQVVFGWVLVPLFALLCRIIIPQPSFQGPVWLWDDSFGLLWCLFTIPASGALGAWWGVRGRNRALRELVWLIAYTILVKATYDATWYATRMGNTG